MTLGEVRDLFRGLLNRDDLTPELEDRFLKLGLLRIQRDLRAPFQERVFWVDAASGPLEAQQLPPDYLEGIEVLVDNQPLAKVPYRLLTRDKFVATEPCTRVGRFRNVLYFRGPVPQGSRMELLYYGEFSPLTGDDDSNELTSAAPDLWAYGALVLAGEHFEHDKLETWKADYASALASVQRVADADNFMGGSMAVEPMYYDPGTP